ARSRWSRHGGGDVPAFLRRAAHVRVDSAFRRGRQYFGGWRGKGRRAVRRSLERGSTGCAQGRGAHLPEGARFVGRGSRSMITTPVDTFVLASADGGTAWGALWAFFQEWPAMWPDLWLGTQDTLYMVWWATFFGVLFGLPLGVLLVVTDREGLVPAPVVRAVASAVVNIGRSLPFIVLMVAVLTLTRFLVGTTIGPTAAIVPLSIGAIPFFARLVETSLREVDREVIEAAHAMGTRKFTIVGKVMLPEALTGLIAGLMMT